VDVVAAAWVIASVVMVLFMIIAWRATGSFGRAWIATLIIGKLIAAIYWAVGIDRPVITLVFRNGARATVTAAEIIFLMFLSTLILSLLVVYGRILPDEIRRVMNPEGERS